MGFNRICILGGTGFVGHSLTNQLVAGGKQVVLLTRHRERHRDLLVHPSVQVVEGDPYNQTVLRNIFSECDAVVNLIAILNERGHKGSGFKRVHVDLARQVVGVAKQSGVQRLLHMSALHASPDGPSHYLRTKGQAEMFVHSAADSNFYVTSFRPSVIFGPGDSFINRFASLLKMAPGVFPLACPNARFRPVYVEDVARVMVHELENKKSYGRRYELCGPHTYTLRELVQYIIDQLNLNVRVLPLSSWQSWLQAAMLEFVPGKPMSIDNFNSLSIDSVCRHSLEAETGFPATPLESIVPSYLGRDKGRHLSEIRTIARR